MRLFVRATILLACGVFAGAFVHAQTEKHQTNDLMLYIAPLEGPDAELVDSIRVKLIRDLEKRGISVTETREDADAILTASGVMRSSIPTRPGRRPKTCIRGTMRLVNKNGVALWAAYVSSSWYAVNESSSFAENVTEKVATALSEESKRRNSEPAAQRIKGMD